MHQLLLSPSRTAEVILLRFGHPHRPRAPSQQKQYHGVDEGFPETTITEPHLRCLYSLPSTSLTLSQKTSPKYLPRRLRCALLLPHATKALAEFSLPAAVFPRFLPFPPPPAAAPPADAAPLPLPLSRLTVRPTALMPSTNLVRKITLALLNMPSLRDTTMNWLAPKWVLSIVPMFWVWEG